jgi:hypothetical protein
MMLSIKPSQLALLYEAVQEEALAIAAKLDGHEFPDLERFSTALKAFCDAMQHASASTISAYRPEMEALDRQIASWRELVQARSLHLRKAMASLPSRHSAYVRRRAPFWVARTGGI